MVTGEFFADYDEETGNGVNKTMYCVGRNGDGTGKDADDDVEIAKKEIGANK